MFRGTKVTSPMMSISSISKSSSYRAGGRTLFIDFQQNGVVKSLRDSKGNCASCISESEKGKGKSHSLFRNSGKFWKISILEIFGKAPPTFFSVSRSQRRFLQIWWLFSFLQGAQSPQLSFLWQPEHSPHRFRFFFVGFSWVSASSPLLNKSG